MSTESNLVLDRLEAELFREARQELAPDPGRVDSLWSSVAAVGALGAAVSSVRASSPPASGTDWVAPRPVTASSPPQAVLPSAAPALTRASATFGLRALAGAAVGGALLGFAAGYGSAGHGARGAQHAVDPPGATTRVMTTASHANPEAEATAAAPDTVLQPTDEQRAPAASRGTSPKAQAAAPSSSAPSSSAPSAEPAKPSFYEELQYLKRAQSALRQGNGALALGLMTELDSIQPGGALLSERGVTKVLAHCQLEDVKSAERVARRLAAHGLASVYAERLENSCAGGVLPKP